MALGKRLPGVYPDELWPYAKLSKYLGVIDNLIANDCPGCYMCTEAEGKLLMIIAEMQADIEERENESNRS